MVRRFGVLTATSSGASRGDRPGELDPATLARAQAGDEAACHALVLRYQQVVWRTLGRVVGRRLRGDAGIPDMAQETFLRVFRQLSTFSPTGPARLSTWISTIATRVAIDELRRRHPESLTDAESSAGLMAPSRADQSARTQDAVAIVERALAALPADWRAVLLLRVEHDLEYQDIARALGIEVGTVRSRLSRARAALWQALSELREAP